MHMLWVCRNEFRSEGAEVLAKNLMACTTLSSLCIKRNFISDKGATSLADLFTKWHNRKLKTLYLGYCNISYEGAKALCSAASVVPLALTLMTLDLTANFLKEEGATAVANVLKENKRIK